MDFEITHTFDAGVDDVAAAILDERYQASLDGLGPLAERRLLAQGRDGETVVRRVRCVLALEAKGPVRRFVGDADPSWIEEATWHPDRRRWDWTIHPEVAADLLDAGGRIELAASGDATVRTTTGHVTVRVPVYRGRVEGWIVDGLTEAYDEEAARLQKWLAAGS